AKALIQDESALKDAENYGAFVVGLVWSNEPGSSDKGCRSIIKAIELEATDKSKQQVWLNNRRQSKASSLLYDGARLLANLGEWREAASAQLRALALRPTPDCYALLADYAFNAKEFQRAKSAADQHLQKAGIDLTRTGDIPIIGADDYKVAHCRI